MSLFFASGASAQTTKKNPLPVAPNVVNPYTCSIAEFRTMALTTHDPQERGDLAAQWLKANGHPLPVLRSQNIPGAIEHNRAVGAPYKHRLSKQLA
jgi:hypothetical protein